MITFVYAQDKKGGIGFNNQLPWHLPNDLHFFKEKTMGHPIVMGRKTFESMNQRLLPGRKTVVISRNPYYGKDIENLCLLTHISPILNLAQDQEIMVIGGSQIFKMFDPYASKIYRTIVDGDFQTDTYVSDIDRSKWRMIEEIEGKVDQDNPFTHRFQTWIREDTMKG